MGEILQLCDEELTILRSTRDQANPSASSPPPSVIPPSGPESQEVPFSAQELLLESASKPAPQPDSVSSEMVGRLLREHEDWVHVRAEFCERILVLEELRQSSLPEASDRSLHDVEFELMMERRMTDMRVRNAEQVVEARMDTIRVRLQAEFDAAQREARRLQDQLA